MCRKIIIENGFAFVNFQLPIGGRNLFGMLLIVVQITSLWDWVGCLLHTLVSENAFEYELMTWRHFILYTIYK